MSAAATIPSERGDRRPGRRRLAPQTSAVLLAVALLAAACGDDGAGSSASPRAEVQARLAALAPAANLAHRGLGPTRPGNPLPENSLAAFRAAMAQGADGVELDVELTADGALLVMHDDTLDRTTTCSGCVNAVTLAAARACRLITGRGAPTEEPPPTLADVYAALPAGALVNVELKVFDAACATPATDAVALARAAAAEVRRLGVAGRTLFSSFDEVAAVEIARAAPPLYAALLTGGADAALLERVAALDLAAIHPIWSGTTAEEIAAAHALGLQVNLWTVNTRRYLEQSLAKAADAIITDEPGVLAELLRTPPPLR